MYPNRIAQTTRWQDRFKSWYRKSSINTPPPGGDYVFQTRLREVGAYLGGGGCLFNLSNMVVSGLYSTANDPQPQMIPKMDPKWSSTASDP